WETTKGKEIFKLQAQLVVTLASTRVKNGIGAHSIAGTKGDLCRGSTGSAATSTFTVVSRGGRGKATLNISDGVGSCTTI
ncbi:hypothetical protein MKW92_043821, partial [Papaver armeniacum]